MDLPRDIISLVKKKTSKKSPQNPWVIIFAVFILISATTVLAVDSSNIILNKLLGIKKNNFVSKGFKMPTPTANPTLTITPAPTIVYKTQNSQNSNTANAQWGVAKQISEHTWTIKVGNDERMATPKEILDALNNYRQKHGSGYIAWDDNLAIFAQNRADYFYKRGNIDEHAGFNQYLNSPDNHFGFRSMGENSSIGYKVLGVHLIEWIYAGDAAHNANQLNPKWTHVGIGVSGTATDLVFGE